MDDGRTVPVWVKRAIVWFWLGGLATFYAVGVVRALRTLLVMLVVSLFVAFALEPAVNFMAGKNIRRGFGTAITFLVVTGLAAGFSAVIGTALASETTYLIEKGPSYIDDIEGWLDDTFGIQLEFDTFKDEFVEGGGVQDLASRFADDVLNVGTTVVSLLFQLFTVALFTFYLVAEGPKLRKMVSARLSERKAAVVTQIWDLAMDKTGSYMYSRTILAALSALVHWIAFAALDVPSPVALALWVGVVSQFIPAIGAYIAGVLPLLVALLHSPRTGALRADRDRRLPAGGELFLLAPDHCPHHGDPCRAGLRLGDRGHRAAGDRRSVPGPAGGRHRAGLRVKLAGGADRTRRARRGRRATRADGVVGSGRRAATSWSR